MKLRYTPAAVRDLSEIKTYIADGLYNPEAAANTIRRIVSSCAKLKTVPRIGAELSKKLHHDIRGRYLIVESYIVLYEAADAVSIIRVLDTRTDYVSILLSELQ